MGGRGEVGGGGASNYFFMLALKFLLKILLCYNIGIIFALDYM